jgi:hypothetical protein
MLVFSASTPPKPYIHVGSRTRTVPAHLPGPSVVGLLRMADNKDVSDAWGEVFDDLKRSEVPEVIARLRERNERDPILYTVSLSTTHSETRLDFYF